MIPIRQLILFGGVAALVAACAHAGQSSAKSDVGARVMAPLTHGDCVEARRRAALRPDLEVERLPAPLAMKPAPFRGMPESVLRKDGSAEIKIDVVIDTLGRANLETFKVVKVSNKWFTDNVRGVIGKWTFTPAVLAGCKVARVYHFMSSVPARTSSSR
ncbi:MAG TPA: hypothetical protein VH539_16040 [Gemmatimonadaceae bacterium]|jgi:hypothetical protein